MADTGSRSGRSIEIPGRDRGAGRVGVRAALQAVRRVLRRVTHGHLVEAELRRKSAEAAAFRLRAQEAEHIIRLTDGLAGIGFWRFEPRTSTRWWSPSIFNIFGLDPAAGAPPRGGVEMFDPPDQEMLRRLIQGAAEGPGPDYEYGIMRGDGARAYIRMSGALERDADGEISHMYGAIIDVTQAKLRELALAESEARYRFMAENVQDVILRIDADGVVVFVSPSVRTLGYEPEAIVGRSIFEFMEAASVERIHESLAAAVAGDTAADPERDEVSVFRADGSVVWMESVGTGIHDETGAYRGAVAVLRDVTERRALEEDLRRKTSEAEAAAGAKSEFLANMSHEIRTPLTAVIGYAGLIAKMTDLPDKARTYADRVSRSGEALNAIVNSILDFSKIEARRIKLRPEPYALRDLVEDALAQVRNSAEQKGLLLRAETPVATPDAVLVDRLLIVQVITNLLANAVKFTETGSVTLRLRHDLADQRLHVAVVDTGIGIAPDQVDRLFERFTQVEASNARRFGGVGLGLPIAKGIIELMGGRIGLESQPDEGSTFSFDIPAPAIAMTPADANAPIDDRISGLRRLRILVADDVTANRDLIAAILGPIEPDIVEAADGAEAVALAGREAFDILLMDVQMPGLDGLAATREIRASSPLNRATPVIAVSASVLPSDVEACLSAGMDDHIPKPISPAELFEKVTAWAERKAGSRESRATEGPVPSPEPVRGGEPSQPSEAPSPAALR